MNECKLITFKDTSWTWNITQEAFSYFFVAQCWKMSSKKCNKYIALRIFPYAFKNSSYLT